MTVIPFDRAHLRQQYANADPFPFLKIEPFLEPSFATEVARAYPSFEEASETGKTFKTVNEKRKVQITDAALFPGPVARLNAALGSANFLADLSYVTGIPNLLADEQLVGAGMHITGPGGRLDVHVDFNFLKERKLYRRLNLLLYLNTQWDEIWGGHIQLWDKDVKHCRQSFAPAFNRCVIFETSNISFHGVTPILNSAPLPRMSFATYYYTEDPPPNWSHTVHSTVFKARPEEGLRKYFLMPVETLGRNIKNSSRRIKKRIKHAIGGSS